MNFDSLSAWVVRKCSLAQEMFELVKGSREEIEVERHRYEGLVIYEVTSDEIENLKTETLRISEDLTFAIAGISIGLSFLAVLLTVDIESSRVFQIFLILCLLGFIVSLYCGIRWIRGRKTFRGTLTRIERRIGPLGQEGQEKAPTDPPGIPTEIKSGGVG